MINKIFTIISVITVDIMKATRLQPKLYEIALSEKHKTLLSIATTKPLIGLSISIKYRLFSPIHLIIENTFMENSFSVKKVKINTQNEPRKPLK